MSDMTGNENYDSAERAWDMESDASGLTRATLALAYEQRTANLIAYYEHTECHFVEIGNQITARLGLEGTR